jgi:hypothetical protein
MATNTEWAATLRTLSRNGNQVALEADEAQEIADLLTAEPEGDGNGEGA